MTTSLIAVEDLVVQYRTRRRGVVTAVDHVDLTIDRGRTLGLVGESGSGKSSIGAVLLGLTPAASGRVLLDGVEMDRSGRAAKADLAGRIQAVFQDPFGSMNPTRTVGETLSETLRFTLRLSTLQIRQRLTDTLAEVGMRPEALERYPGQFSGGQLQRLAIARAVAVEPEFIVCDEAVSALDLSVQAQVINLLARLAADRGIGYLFISHDLSVVRHLSDEVAVLFAGQVVERGPATVVADRPGHPYTQSLVLAAPVPDPQQQRTRRTARRSLGVHEPGLVATGSPGCPFAVRCPFAIERCRNERPALTGRESGVAVACHRYDELAAATANTGEMASPATSTVGIDRRGRDT